MKQFETTWCRSENFKISRSKQITTASKSTSLVS